MNKKVTIQAYFFSTKFGGLKPCLKTWKPFGLLNESDLHLHLTQVQVSDFYELRQGFIPPGTAKRRPG